MKRKRVLGLAAAGALLLSALCYDSSVWRREGGIVNGVRNASERISDEIANRNYSAFYRKGFPFNEADFFLSKNLNPHEFLNMFSDSEKRNTNLEDLANQSGSLINKNGAFFGNAFVVPNENSKNEYFFFASNHQFKKPRAGLVQGDVGWHMSADFDGSTRIYLNPKFFTGDLNPEDSYLSVKKKLISSEKQDLLIGLCEGPEAKVQDFYLDTNSKVGDKIYIIPSQHPKDFSSLRKSEILDGRLEKISEPYVLTSILGNVGHSGSAIVNKNGHVVGIATNKLADIRGDSPIIGVRFPYLKEHLSSLKK